MSEEPFDDLELGATLRGFAAGQTLFGRFRLVRTIGRGGMGVVWLAQDEQLEREVALKFLPEMLVSDRTALEDLKRETRRSLSLTHHHIVRIFDFHQQGNVAGISMEYVDGDTLSNVRVEHGVRTFNPGQLGATVKQLCEALDYAHGRAKIVHRDLKPANLMVNRAGELKVTDFGISASITESASRVSMRPSGGTLVYMSPQQLMGEEPCVADDIYSLGATLYDLITGKPPFYQGNIDLQVREKVPPPMAQRREALGNTGEPIPQVWEETIAACLAKDSAQRPQNAGEVWERLSGEWRAGASPGVPQSVKETGKANSGRIAQSFELAIPKAGGKAVLVGAVLTLLLVGSAIVWWRGIEMPKRAEAVRRAKARVDATQRQRDEAEAARIAEEGRVAEEERKQGIAAAKLRAEVDRQIQTKIEDAMKLAQRELIAMRYAETRKAYQDVLVLDPENAIAKAGLGEVDRVERAATEMALKKRKFAINQGLKTAQSAFTANRYAEARKAYQDVLVEDPENTMAKDGLLKARIAEHEAFAIVEKQKAKEDEEKRAEKAVITNFKTELEKARVASPPDITEAFQKVYDSTPPRVVSVEAAVKSREIGTKLSQMSDMLKKMSADKQLPPDLKSAWAEWRADFIEASGICKNLNGMGGALGLTLNSSLAGMHYHQELKALQDKMKRKGKKLREIAQKYGLDMWMAASDD
jgi:tetratricopeptide (TPR) repeat protein